MFAFQISLGIETIKKIAFFRLYQFGCGISKMVGPKKQDFWPKINILLKGKIKKKVCL